MVEMRFGARTASCVRWMDAGDEMALVTEKERVIGIQDADDS